jgi:type I restriction enzyme M protein
VVEIEFQNKTKDLIDSLKAICATNGLGNSTGEFEIITQVFLYKFLNDKFAFEAKKIDSSIAATEKWEDALSAMSEDDLEMLQLQMGADTARLKPHHFISYLFTKQNEPDFAKLFDDTLMDIAIINNDVFAVMTDSGEKVQLFTRISENVTVSKRDQFCKAIINKLIEFSFERIFTQKFDFYATIFEYLVKDYNSNSGGKYAEYYTPHAVARIMADILVPEEVRGKIRNVSCYDPSAGSGTLLMNVAHAIGENRCSIYTQDISKKSSNLLRLNLILNNLVHSIPNVIEGDTLRHPHHKEGQDLKKFDYIVSNPPFKLDFSDIRDELDSKANNDRFFAGIPKVKPKDKDKMEIYLLFLQHIMFSLSEAGKAAIVVPTGFISAKKGIEKAIREKIVDRKMLSGIISMPSNIFASTNTSVTVIFLDKKNNGKSIFIDASKLGDVIKDGKNQKTVLSSDEESLIVSTFVNKKEVENFSVLATCEEIIKKHYSFSTSQFFEVKIEHTPITSTEFNARIKEIKSNIEKIYDKNTSLEKALKSKLENLSNE